jgi:hypothetical protein
MKVSFLDKLPLYTRIGWGLVALFALMGVLLGKPAGVMVGVVASVVWVLSRMIDEARASWTALGVIKQVEASGEPTDDAKDEEDGPKDPPQAT